ncbi:Outer membrane protein assembly factor BamB, contains PQQ-like beta-propeller repeat [Neorhodopirellula lusitana]|uniref:Outer membrane protein assembly factor BamB, contains PQQ-like beta-propeller repeat n=1 Tax=Neorhodopirellula lusitana TaxID=445327 RepID=A0ABY1QK95_9BACT|nr:PQQ-binding-like beta-propeller repeat protein [Neorhodopirellula lusitana]SMP73268.1 Outer membrane protein assembly factor BamB, contains PQQ-like beta-propeller repeat [Neorhodopirellula lusitana]
MNHLILAAYAMLSLAGVDAWPAFLGGGADPISSENLPLQWTPTEHVAWQQEIRGHGQSSPVVWDNLVFVTSVEGPEKNTFYTTCFDITSGKKKWEKALTNSFPVTNSYYVSRAAPTPIADQDRIVALFESGDCVAYDHDGNELWVRTLGKDEGPLTAEFGLGASPCQTADDVIVLLEHDGPSCLLALDKKTGSTSWKADRDPRRSWSSPAIVEVAGVPQIVVSSAGTIDGYAPATGKLLWTFDDVGGNTGTSPRDCGNGRFLVGASPGRNGENAGSAAGSNGLMQVTRDGDQWEVQRKWVAEKATPSWASPILHNGLAYWVNRAGVVYCFDAETGESLYTKRIEQSCWATPVAAGDRIYFFGTGGTVTVLSAGREFKVLAENETWTDESLPKEQPLAEEKSEERRRGVAMFSRPTLYGVAVASDAFLIRVGNALICVR